MVTPLIDIIIVITFTLLMFAIIFGVYAYYRHRVGDTITMFQDADKARNKRSMDDAWSAMTHIFCFLLGLVVAALFVWKGM